MTPLTVPHMTHAHCCAALSGAHPEALDYGGALGLRTTVCALCPCVARASETPITTWPQECFLTRIRARSMYATGIWDARGTYGHNNACSHAYKSFHVCHRRPRRPCHTHGSCTLWCCSPTCTRLWRSTKIEKNCLRIVAMWHGRPRCPSYTWPQECLLTPTRTCSMCATGIQDAHYTNVHNNAHSPAQELVLCVPRVSGTTRTTMQQNW